MEQVMVTGGCGFIGSNFIHDMLKQSNDLFIHNVDKQTYASNLHNLDGIDESRHQQYAYCDLAWDWNVKTISNIIKEHKITKIFHFAAQTHVDRSINDPLLFLKDNVLGTMHLLEGIRESKLYPLLVHVSTDEVYGSLSLGTDPDNKSEFIEADTINPSSPYSASKAAAEAYVKAYSTTWQLPSIIVRCANAYGPRQHDEKFIPTVIRHALRGEPIPLYGDGLNERQWTHVSDINDGIMFVSKNGLVGDTYNIASSFDDVIHVSNLHLIQMMFPEATINKVPDRLGHDTRYYIDTFKLKSLGWTPKVHLIDGLSSTIEWYKRLYERNH